MSAAKDRRDRSSAGGLVIRRAADLSADDVRGTAEGGGSVGPIATLRPGDQATALRFVIAELAARGEERATVVVPGPNLAAQRVLWEAGFAFEGVTGLVCASRPFARFDRYVLAGDSIM